MTKTINVHVANPRTDATPEQLAALQRYATAHGRKWKASLSLAWSTGADEQEDDSAELRQVRNYLGSRWLYRTCKIKP